jgi:hypothetical protein
MKEVLLPVFAVSAGVAASPQGRVRPGPGHSDRGGGGPAEQVPVRRKTWHWDSGRTSLRRVRNYGSQGGRWIVHEPRRAGPESYRSSRCARTGRTCEDAATSLRRLGIQRNRCRWGESKRRFQVWRSLQLSPRIRVPSSTHYFTPAGIPGRREGSPPPTVRIHLKSRTVPVSCLRGRLVG